MIDPKGDVTEGTYAWNSKVVGLVEEQAPMPNPLGWKATGAGAAKVWHGEVKLPESVTRMVGDDARLTFSVNRWD